MTKLRQYKKMDYIEQPAIKKDNKRILLIDYAILFCLSVLIFVLPIAHTATIRSFAIYAPVILLAARYNLSKDFHWDRTRFEWQFIAFFLVASASLITSVDFHESLKEIWGELLSPILLFYITYLSIKKDNDAVLLLKILFLGSLIFSVYSFYDLQKHGGSLVQETYRAGGLRDPGGGEVAGLYHTMVIPFIFWGMFYFKKKWQKIGLFSLLIINMVALHITFTRAAVLAVGVQCVLITILLFLEKRWLLGILTACLIILISSVYIENKMFRKDHAYKMPSFQQYLAMKPEEIAKSDAQAVEQRLAMWKTAIEKISQNPFYAHGYSRFLFGRSVRANANEHFIYPQTHNTFIGIAFELGIQGLIIFLWMIGSFFYVCWKHWFNSLGAKETQTHYLSASLLVVMTGYWTNNFFGSFDGDDSKLLFMMMLGIGMAVMHKLQHERYDNKQTNK